ncbi:uncharacterized protein MYCFIDRAFT_208577 [Pseudocercospora fijiensis CIRAD86]|uniref:Uncharacterized protein n=1 Tax=Pseudocercospora fijiensis (strain CIRAD86) TaxID=383855 RepID=M2ZMR5_PSEFD|nr:uncharacterized protein MYCFIDRAFT_208577 [Pseudocercospora fijiensis CIRAD86]EME80394.1 hypothetical protein MYCFIDRAFT_208577 [Pseudocercospora fijiensis CIRAD86]
MRHGLVAAMAMADVVMAARRLFEDGGTEADETPPGQYHGTASAFLIHHIINPQAGCTPPLYERGIYTDVKHYSEVAFNLTTCQPSALTRRRAGLFAYEATSGQRVNEGGPFQPVPSCDLPDVGTPRTPRTRKELNSSRGRGAKDLESFSLTAAQASCAPLTARMSNVLALHVCPYVREVIWCDERAVPYRRICHKARPLTLPPPPSSWHNFVSQLRAALAQNSTRPCHATVYSPWLVVQAYLLPRDLCLKFGIFDIYSCCNNPERK